MVITEASQKLIQEREKKKMTQLSGIYGKTIKNLPRSGSRGSTARSKSHGKQS